MRTRIEIIDCRTQNGNNRNEHHSIVYILAMWNTKYVRSKR